MEGSGTQIDPSREWRWDRFRPKPENGRCAISIDRAILGTSGFPNEKDALAIKVAAESALIGVLSRHFDISALLELVIPSWRAICPRII